MLTSPQETKPGRNHCGKSQDCHPQRPAAGPTNRKGPTMLCLTKQKPSGPSSPGPPSHHLPWAPAGRLQRCCMPRAQPSVQWPSARAVVVRGPLSLAGHLPDDSACTMHDGSPEGELMSHSQQMPAHSSSRHWRASCQQLCLLQGVGRRLGSAGDR